MSEIIVIPTQITIPAQTRHIIVIQFIDRHIIVRFRDRYIQPLGSRVLTFEKVKYQLYSAEHKESIVRYLTTQHVAREQRRRRQDTSQE